MMADGAEADDAQEKSDLDATLELLEEATFAACMKMKVKDLKAELELVLAAVHQDTPYLKYAPLRAGV